MTRVVAFVLAAVLVGCGDPSGTIFRTTVAGPDGSYAQEVVLGDGTGLVTALDPAVIDSADAFDPPSIAADPKDPHVLVFRWSNGACDHPAIALARAGDRLAISVNPREPLFGSCMAILLFRAVRITLSDTVSPDTIDIQLAR